MNNSNINFNPAFGDISILYNDINLLRSPEENHAHTLINLFKTDFKDYELDPDYGMDLDRFLGLGITEDLANNIKLDLSSRIRKFTLIPGMESVEILHFIENNTIHFRIIVPGMNSLNLSFLQDKGFTVE